MRLRPVKNRIFIRPIEESYWTPVGLYLPGVARSKPTRGHVIATGPDVRDVLSGDEVHYDRFSVTELMADGEILVIATEKELIARLRDE